MITRNKEASEKLEKVLDKKSADINAADINAAMELIRQGADPDLRNYADKTLLHIICKINQNGIYDQMIEELVKIYKANINLKEKYNGRTPLEYFLTYINLSPSYFESAMKMVRLGADPNSREDSGFTNESLLELLIFHNKNGANDAALNELINVFNVDINKKDNEGFTPLQNLMQMKVLDSKAIMSLIRLGANFNVTVKKHDQEKTLLELLISKNSNGQYDAAIKEIEEHNRLRTKPISYFLQLLFILNKDRNNSVSDSFFKYLPMELVLKIISYLDFQTVGRKQEVGLDLANYIFSQPKFIEQHASIAGKMRFCPALDKEKNQYSFSFFHILPDKKIDLRAVEITSPGLNMQPKV